MKLCVSRKSVYSCRQTLNFLNVYFQSRSFFFLCNTAFFCSERICCFHLLRLTNTHWKHLSCLTALPLSTYPSHRCDNSPSSFTPTQRRRLCMSVNTVCKSDLFKMFTVPISIAMYEASHLLWYGMNSPHRFR
ncbi:uncharacterized protein LOC125501666 [Athalia rosae]|uniref:uncharacterized protein LOC125501666 n=1 Tax=Athalia rosae TaxID=37344 RepID=UPI0020347801|nr:uncharacterized protein LOC125501666 [Athalia rosae]